MQFINKYPNLILAAFILINFLCADGLRVTNYPPCSVHQWRQSDCVAYAKTYYYKNTGLFTPSTYNRMGADGRVVSEFPIIYYVSAQLFRFFGVHYFVIRGLTFLCLLLGLFYLFGCVRIWIKNPLLAILPVIFLATSPFFYYYALNFLPNVPAIAFSFAGLYYLLRYQHSGKVKWLWVATAVFIFSSLLKPTDGSLVWFAWLAVACVQFISKKKDAAFNTRLLPVAISGLLILGSIYGWYKYAVWYNDSNGNHQNLLGIYPIWEMNADEIKHTIGAMMHRWLPDYQYIIVLVFLFFLMVIYVIKWKKMDPFLRQFTLFLVAGTVAYDLLWFKAFTIHDYYQLANVIAPVFIYVTVAQYYEYGYPSRRQVIRILPVVALVLVLLSIYHNAQRQNERYTNPRNVVINPAIFELEPYLRKIGVGPDAVVISVPDKTPNTSLAAMNNPGFTEALSAKDVNVRQLHQEFGASYLIINDSSYLDNALYKPYMTKLIGNYKGIYIFDIR